MSEKVLVTDVVCPNCFKVPGSVTVMGPRPDRYGRMLRSYFGWCIECHRGFEVVQFASEGKWLIHKYRFFQAVAPEGFNVPDWWNTVQELPLAPMVQTGPGGEYDQAPAIQTDPQRIATILMSIKGVLDSISQTMDNLIQTVLDNGKQQR